MDKISKQFPILSKQKTTDIFLKVDNKMTKSKKLKIERFIKINLILEYIFNINIF
jgi:hypothetical protein